jgi:hypothetical protein
VLSIEHQQMVRALAPDRANQALDVSVLPRRSERCGSVPDPHRPDASLEYDAKCFVIVANEIFRRAVPWKRFSDLPRQPLRRRTLSGGRRKKWVRLADRSPAAAFCECAPVGIRLVRTDSDRARYTLRGGGACDRGLGRGRNIRIDYRFSAGDPARAKHYAAELVSLAPDVIVGNSTPVITALRQVTSTNPIKLRTTPSE